MLLMLTIFPIANADGKIKEEDESVLLEVLKTTIVPTNQKQFVDYVEVEKDTVGDGAEAIDREIEEIVEKSAEVATGIVSWYGDRFHGRKTASGEIYDKNELTAAHKTLPFGTKVRVTNIKNGKSVVVEINDRGPYIKSRVLDLSQAAFSEIGKTNSGVMQVEYEVLDN